VSTARGLTGGTFVQYDEPVVVEQKLSLLGGNAQFDLSCACSADPPRQRGPQERWIYPAVLPGGRRVHTLKVLLDNACHSDCAYCAQRSGRNTPRDRFQPGELARLFDQMHRAGLVKALFLSSGLGGNAVRTMDRMIETVETVRRRYRFRGFVHLKILPGSQLAQVERAAQLAQRISINLEAPGERRLAALSGSKNFQSGILTRMWWIAKLVHEKKFLAKGHTTQFVVGASGESDREIANAASRLYKDYRLTRAYYSKFNPVLGTPLENHPPVPFMREHRLYQVDFLLRKYNFPFEDIPFEADGNLSLLVDPKTAWARLHPERFPVEVNRAEKEELLRVPGLGLLTVQRILEARARQKFRSLSDLKKLNPRTGQAAEYLLFDGRKEAQQVSLL
jgi:predicted DNA-binding helix-hairpin-helix protein